jgi:hypothetical protein
MKSLPDYLVTIAQNVNRILTEHGVELSDFDDAQYVSEEEKLCYKVTVLLREVISYKLYPAIGRVQITFDKKYEQVGLTTIFATGSLLGAHREVTKRCSKALDLLGVPYIVLDKK